MSASTYLGRARQSTAIRPLASEAERERDRGRESERSSVHGKLIGDAQVLSVFSCSVNFFFPVSSRSETILDEWGSQRETKRENGGGSEKVARRRGGNVLGENKENG